ncbi:class I SAM-dependent methyltransferase [Ilyobacter sp.]|uniref:class I SAM-dependent methyltransferase n=1 Tax=Ilyobacter sp. TaxID=3100343 RepID=UPI003566C509
MGDKTIKIISASAEELPFDDHTFDCVVIILALCTIPNPDKSLKEVRRICKFERVIEIYESILKFV